jgi:signal transduction histidine kinase
MRLFSSLRTRIFLGSAVLAVLAIGVALFVVNVSVTREAEAALQRELTATGHLVDQLRTTRAETFRAMARLIADIPQLNAATATNDPQTVQDIAEEYQQRLNSNLLLVTDKNGGVLATVGGSAPAARIVAGQPSVRDALHGRERVSVLPQSNGMLQVVTVPIGTGLTHPEMLGTLSVGFLLDDRVAAELKAITGSDVAFAMDGEILATTLPMEERPVLAGLLRRPGGVHDVHIGGADYVVLQRQLTASGDGEGPAGGPVALILRSRTEELAGLFAIQAALGATAIVAVILATLLSFAVARTITRPLADITDAMREVAATGDLTRKIATRHRRWDDEDAHLLMTTFNTLTDSIARFQREMSQKERLSSLGRLSTVIAHEIRNPLMIIKASLHALRNPDVSPDTVKEAVTDIDDEVSRLNRIVNQVLDFARPIRFDLAPADLNAICRESAAAAQASGPHLPIHLELDRSLPIVRTDAERVRLAVVNMLLNARHAVSAREVSRPEHPDGARRAEDAPRIHSTGAGAERSEAAITLQTETKGERVAIVIKDRGIGIQPADLSRMFDPYFTTKRGGTGLGLALAKNIIEGLHGTIAVTSVPGAGTAIHIDLPADAGPVTEH